MNEWQKLDQYNLPADILVPGKYEFYQWVDRTVPERCVGWIPATQSLQGIMGLLITGRRFLYRKIEPKAPTHEEILSGKYWHVEDGDGFSYWTNTIDYSPERGYFAYYDASGEPVWTDRAYFAGRESADIPPE